MPQASVKRLIEADKQKLIELVLDIEKYKDFIPYCLDSKVYERNDKGDKIFIVADLTIGKGIFKDTYFKAQNDKPQYNWLSKYFTENSVTEDMFNDDAAPEHIALNNLKAKHIPRGVNEIKYTAPVSVLLFSFPSSF